VLSIFAFNPPPSKEQPGPSFLHVSHHLHRRITEYLRPRSTNKHTGRMRKKKQSSFPRLMAQMHAAPSHARSASATETPVLRTISSASVAVCAVMEAFWNNCPQTGRRKIWRLSTNPGNEMVVLGRSPSALSTPRTRDHREHDDGDYQAFMRSGGGELLETCRFVLVGRGPFSGRPV
jgi:hypothetical protein